MFSDLRLAFRMLAKSPGFTGIAIVTLALGIGAATTCFTALNALLIRPLPYIQHQERMLYVNEAIPSKGVDGTDICYLDFVDWQKRAKTLEAIWLYDNRTVILSGNRQAERVLGSGLTPGAFAAMGVKPMLGRDFRAQDDALNATPVALISFGLWKNRFAGNPEAVGQTVTLNGQLTTIIGVMPEGWRYPETSDVWMPMRHSPNEDHRGSFAYSGHAMLKPGVSLDEARAELAGIAAALGQEFPSTNEGLTVVLRPVREEASEHAAQLTVLLFGAVMFVFLIACANVANLLLARATARSREIAVRLALGATRRRLLAQLLTESLLLSALGGIGGLFVGLWGVDLMLSAIPIEIPFWLRFDFDGRVFAFVVVLSTLASLLFGFFPAMQASRPEVMDDLKEGGRTGSSGARGHRLRQILVVTEIALALVLLVGAGLMMRSFLMLDRVQPGFDSHNVLTFRAGFPLTMSADKVAMRKFFEDLTKRLAALPGVESAAATTALPALGIGGYTALLPEGQPLPRSFAETAASLARTVTPDFFATARIPLVRGRMLAATDDDSRPRVAIVDEVFAKKFFPNQNPIGRRFRNNLKAGEAPQWIEIVGVVAPVRRWFDRAEGVPTYYIPLAQDSENFMSLMMRVHGDPVSYVTAARNEVLSVNKDIPIYNVFSLDAAINRADSVWKRRFFGYLFTAFAAIALVLASIGIYGVMSYSVAQRTQEIGVRMALGAQAGDVIRMIVFRGLQLVAIGLVAGFVVAYLTAELLASGLYGVSPHDPPTFALVPLFLAAVALLACWIPSRRATRVDPIIALRGE